MSRVSPAAKGRGAAPWLGCEQQVREVVEGRAGVERGEGCRVGRPVGERNAHEAGRRAGHGLEGDRSTHAQRPQVDETRRFEVPAALDGALGPGGAELDHALGEKPQRVGGKHALAALAEAVQGGAVEVEVKGGWRCRLGHQLAVDGVGGTQGSDGVGAELHEQAPAHPGDAERAQHPHDRDAEQDRPGQPQAPALQGKEVQLGREHGGQQVVAEHRQPACDPQHPGGGAQVDGDLVGGRAVAKRPEDPLAQVVARAQPLPVAAKQLEGPGAVGQEHGRRRDEQGEKGQGRQAGGARDPGGEQDELGGEQPDGEAAELVGPGSA